MPASTRLSPVHARPRAEPPPCLLPFISVIVPVRNEERFIGRLLDQLLGQNYNPERFEVIVVDGESTDSTRSVVAALQARHPNLRLLPNPRRLSSAGRNRAIQTASGQYIVLVDGHCEVENSDYLLDLAEVFALTGADCVGRPQPLDFPGAPPLQRAIAAARASRLGHHPDSYIYSSVERFVPPQSVAVAYRRSVFDTVGLFDEDFDACEDVDFNHRVDAAGLRCFFSPRVKVRYHPRTTLRGLFQQMRRYGRGRLRLSRKHPETFTWAGFAPAAFLVAALLALPAALASGWLAAASATMFGLYGLAVLVTSVAIVLRKRDVKLLPWLLLVFPAIHFGAGFGILKEWLWGARRSRPAGVPGVVPEQTP
jgi:glycosyltransferase involved in cell wall biosynthesis